MLLKTPRLLPATGVPYQVTREEMKDEIQYHQQKGPLKLISLEEEEVRQAGEDMCVALCACVWTQMHASHIPHPTPLTPLPTLHSTHAPPHSSSGMA
jgi:hypothetical protein